MGISAVLHVVTEDIEHADHLAENKYPMAVGFQPNKKLVQEYKLAAVNDNAFEGLVLVVGILLRALEEEWMVGSFFSSMAMLRRLMLLFPLALFTRAAKF